jgi:hypothetical protein
MSEHAKRERRAKKTHKVLVEEAPSKSSPDMNDLSLLNLQHMVGNQAVQRLLLQRKIELQTKGEQRIQRAPPTASAAPAAGAQAAAMPAPADYSKMSEAELRTQYAVIQFMLMTPPLPMFKAFIDILQKESEKIKQALIDRIVKEQIKSLLSQFQTISVKIPGATLPPGQMGPPAPRPITFHAAYFINTDTAKEYVKDARDKSDFSDIVKSENKSGETSVIQSSGKEYKSGAAVKVGKATPENVQQFTQEAIDNGTIRSYAIQKNKLTASQQLSDLGTEEAGKLVQDWVIDNGVGVDCSGFVLQAAIRARDAVRDELRGLGIPDDKLPKEVGHEERKAKSFDQGTKVDHPKDLRPGDAWVLNNGAHVKIVIETREISKPNGSKAIEIDTAESAGGSTDTDTGPTQGKKQTTSLTVFGISGSFHRI